MKRYVELASKDFILNDHPFLISLHVMANKTDTCWVRLEIGSLIHSALWPVCARKLYLGVGHEFFETYITVSDAKTREKKSFL
jgi:hypothetical protein